MNEQKRQNQKNTKRRWVIALVIALFFACFFLFLRSGMTEPENPITEGGNLTPETMTIAASSNGGDGDGAGESEEVDPDAGQQEEPDKEKQEENQQQNEETKPNVEIGENEGGLDGVADSDKATDQEGGGGTGRPSLDPSKQTDDVKIMTDLKNQDITDSQLPDGEFEFYAYLLNAEDDMSLRVKLTNSETPMNGRYLKSDNRNFTASLVHGRNTITLYIRQGSKTYYQVSYIINYMADKADEDNPTVGTNPPTITAWVDGEVVEGTDITTSNRNFMLQLQAVAANGSSLSYDNMTVLFDGQRTGTPTGSGVYEYDFYLENPVEGDVAYHTITVLAWDNDGNSRFVKYNLTYEFIDTGDVIGTCYVTIDATTIGLGIIADGFEYEVKQDEPASYAILAALDDYGFTADYSGTADVGFYLRGISQGGIAYGASIPDTLWQKILDDGLYADLSLSSRDSITELQYTQGSGWMYTIDGVNYPGRGMSQYYLNGHNNHITLRFTLSYGKDLGLTVSSPPSNLSSYCGVWINGGYEARHQLDDGAITKEATCTEDGEWARTCEVPGCGHQEIQVIPALGHEYVETERVPATSDTDGYVIYTCSRCGESYTEVLPRTGGGDGPYEPVEPENPEEPGEPRRR